MKTPVSVVLLLLASTFSPTDAGASPQLSANALSTTIVAWASVRQGATQSLALARTQPELQPLVTKTQQDIEAINGTMAQIEDLVSSRTPDKNTARLLVAKLRRYQSQLQQTEQRLVALSNPRTQGTAAKKRFDDAKEQFKKSLKILHDHAEQMMQVLQKVDS